MIIVRERLASACWSVARLRDLAISEIALRLQHADLLLGRDRIGLCRGQRGLVLLKIRRGLLRLLDRSRALAGQLLIAFEFLTGESQRGLRLSDLFVGLIDFRLLRGNLGGEVLDASLRLRDLRLRLIALGDIVAVVETDQFGAGIDQLVVRDRNIDDRGADLGADLHGTGIDESIISRFIVSCMQPPGDEQGDQNNAADSDQGHEGAAFTQTLSPRRFIPCLIECRRRRPGWRIKALGIGAALVVDA